MRETIKKEKALEKRAYVSAVRAARGFAKEGPRVAAVVKHGKSYSALAGFIDADTKAIKQIALVTPDGRVWMLPEPQ